jgi:hypothetical protein
VIAGWPFLYPWAIAQPEPKKWYVQAIITFHPWLPIACIFLIAVVEIAYECFDHSSKRVLKKILDHMHKKYFPHETGGLNPNYRITVFKPGWLVRSGSLGVWARSGTMHQKSRLRWNIKQSEDGRFHGIVGNAWATSIFVTIDGLPDYSAGTIKEKDDYLKRTFITQEEVLKLNWTARSYRCLIIKNRSDERVGVLMMESKHPNGLEHITADALTGECEYLQLLLS